jgi:hypothetical protein
MAADINMGIYFILNLLLWDSIHSLIKANLKRSSVLTLFSYWSLALKTAAGARLMKALGHNLQEPDAL